MSPTEKAAKMNKDAIDYIKKLGFGAIKVVSEAREKEDLIKNVADTGDMKPLDGSSDELLGLVKIFNTTLVELKSSDPVAYVQAVRNVNERLSEIKENSAFKLWKMYSNK